MSTYTIRPTRNGFGVFSGRTWLGKPRLLQEHERLYNAEMHALQAVIEDNHRLLDYDRLTNQVMSTDMMKPRVNEEHIYTALVLAGKKPRTAEPEEVDNYAVRPMPPESYKRFDHLLEHLGTPITHVARVMFEERFMTWYGAQKGNESWVDPRREREYNVARDALGGNRYRDLAVAGGVAKPVSPSLLRTMMDAARRLIPRKRGPTNQEVEVAGNAMTGSGR